MKLKSIPLLFLISLPLVFTACTDDEEKYASEPPLFSNITAKVKGTGSEELHVGDSIVITAVQSKAGRLLYQAKYNWSSTPDGLTHLKPSQTVVYDNEPQDPSETVIATAAGSYTLTFSAKYDNSGNTTYWGNKYGYSFTQSFETGGGSATYNTGGAFYFTVTATKTIKVQE